MTNSKIIKFDLGERTEKFALRVIELCKRISHNVITRPLINQLIKSSTSVGANYCEADNAESKLDFKHKIAICKKEAKESQFFLKMILKASQNNDKEIDILINEVHELNLIFNTIYKKLKK